MEYAGRIEASHPLRLSPWVQVYLEAVFAEIFGLEDFQKALLERKNFLGSLRSCFSLPHRLLGFLNPINLMDRRT